MAQIYNPGTAETKTSCGAPDAGLVSDNCYEQGLIAATSEWYSGKVKNVDVAVATENLAFVSYYDNDAGLVKAVAVIINDSGGMELSNNVQIGDNYQNYKACAVYKLSDTRAVVCYYPSYKVIDLIVIQYKHDTLATISNVLRLTADIPDDIGIASYLKSDDTIIFVYHTYGTIHIDTITFDGTTLEKFSAQTFGTGGSSGACAVYQLSTDLLLYFGDGYVNPNPKWEFRVIQFLNLLSGDTGQVGTYYGNRPDIDYPFIVRISASRYIAGATHSDQSNGEAELVLIEIVDRPLNLDGTTKTPPYEVQILSGITTLNAGENYNFNTKGLSWKPAFGMPDRGQGILLETFEDDSVGFYTMSSTGSSLVYTGPTTIINKLIYGAVDKLSDDEALIAGYDSTNALTLARMPL